MLISNLKWKLSPDYIDLFYLKQFVIILPDRVETTLSSLSISSPVFIRLWFRCTLSCMKCHETGFEPRLCCCLWPFIVDKTIRFYDCCTGIVSIKLLFPSSRIHVMCKKMTKKWNKKWKKSFDWRLFIWPPSSRGQVLFKAYADEIEIVDTVDSENRFKSGCCCEQVGWTYNS